MKKLTKIYLIILIIISFSIFISTFVFAFFSDTKNPIFLLLIGTISFFSCNHMNEEILIYEVPKEIEDDETFS